MEERERGKKRERESTAEEEQTLLMEERFIQTGIPKMDCRIKVGMQK